MLAVSIVAGFHLTAHATAIGQESLRETGVPHSTDVVRSVDSTPDGASCNEQVSSRRNQIRDGLRRGGWRDRYFSYNGKFNYYVGFDVQQLHADTNIDYKAKLDFLATYGVNKVRIWLHPSWFGLPGQSNYPKTGKILFPWRVDESSNKFDLDNWDADFWNRAKAFLAYARSKNIIVEISLFSVQEPRDYFDDPSSSYPFNHEFNLQNFGRPTDINGKFLRGFYDLAYEDNGLKLHDYHRAYIDKALSEFASYDHIYFELMNEAPGEPFWVGNSLPQTWMKYWLNYLSNNSDRLITAHTSGFMNLKSGNKRNWSADDFNSVGRLFWKDSNVDGINFHLYSTNPNDISMALSGFQLKGQMLINNEGGTFYDVDKSDEYLHTGLKLRQNDLHGEIRHAWGMMTAGGYYSIYFGPVPQLGSETAIEAARAMQAMRNIVEMTDFRQLRPVRCNGVEYDDLVTRGPATNWQVIANEGADYIVFFWEEQSTDSTEVFLPAGNYAYFWMDTRVKRDPLMTGTVELVHADNAIISLHQ